MRIKLWLLACAVHPLQRAGAALPHSPSRAVQAGREQCRLGVPCANVDLCPVYRPPDHFTPAVVFLPSRPPLPQATLTRLEGAIDDFERYHQGVYLGFDGLRQLRDEFQLLDLWEGSSLHEELFVDVRQPKVEEDTSNLWLMGNQFASSAREVLHNHELIAQATGNDFRADRNWQYVMQNGPVNLNHQYLQSLSGLLQRCAPAHPFVKASICLCVCGRASCRMGLLCLQPPAGAAPGRRIAAGHCADSSRRLLAPSMEAH